MPEDADSQGAVSSAELAELAELFDKFEFAFDPLSKSAKEAESQFEDRVREIFVEKVQPRYPNLASVVFRCRIKSLCRAYLRKNAP